MIRPKGTFGSLYFFHDRNKIQDGAQQVIQSIFGPNLARRMANLGLIIG